MNVECLMTLNMYIYNNPKELLFFNKREGKKMDKKLFVVTISSTTSSSISSATCSRRSNIYSGLCTSNWECNSACKIKGATGSICMCFYPC